VQREVVVTIEKIIAKGYGISRWPDGRAVMIPRVLPGEEVLVRMEKNRSDHLTALPIRILSPSPWRREPDCPLFPRCGGCALRHCLPAHQPFLKEGIVRDVLERFDLQPRQEKMPLFPSPLADGYRYRLRLHLDPEGRLGLRRHHSHRVIPVHHCLLAAPAINDVLARLQAFSVPLSSWSEELTLSCSPADKGVHLSLRPRRNSLPPRDLLKQLRGTGLASLFLEQERKGESRDLSVPGLLGQHFPLAGGYTLHWDSRIFFQTNPQQNQVMVREVCALAATPPGQVVVDLFCGMGNFTLPLALLGHRVLGVETDRLAVRDARANRSALGLARQQADFLRADVHGFLQRQTRDHRPPPDLVFLDPPRRGLGKAARQLARWRPSRILYLACDPVSQARDLKTLIRSGYRLMQIGVFDLFPQSHHVETLALLESN